ncbi:hypothetical protein HF086_012042 [Spodoptera exigua]|uniref:Uncharacterized protein n=1 Tax=Spodoptera exigua TaxID=7107 RepID=A0A922SHK2_SPOEX|nr:hypothetical protein HF086_012042 [Spodoptera exigua]
MPMLKVVITEMRSFIIITVLSALAACYGAAVLPNDEERNSNYTLEPKNNEDDGVKSKISTFGAEVKDTDGLEQQFVRTAVPNVIHNVDVLYYGQPPRVIKAAVIQTFPTASWIFPVWHLDNYISIRISSQRGHGMNGTVQIYGTL